MIAAIASLGPAGVHAQEDVHIKTTPVAGNVYMLEGEGGNIGVSVGSDGILIVDDQFARIADKVRAALRDLNPGPLKFILNTHFHGDHVGANPIFGKEGTIVAHTNVRKRLSAPQERGGRAQEAMDPAGWPVVTFDQSVSVHFNGEEIRVIHHPAGHTDGDAVVYFAEANVVHMGDLLFSGRFPFIDLDAGGTIDGYAKNLETVMTIVPADAKVIPGHGPLSTMEDVKKAHDMIAETSEHVRKMIRAGKSLDEIKKAGLPSKYASWSWQFISTEKWIEMIHTAYSK